MIKCYISEAANFERLTVVKPYSYIGKKVLLYICWNKNGEVYHELLPLSSIIVAAHNTGSLCN